MISKELTTKKLEACAQSIKIISTAVKDLVERFPRRIRSREVIVLGSIDEQLEDAVDALKDLGDFLADLREDIESTASA